MEEVMGSIEGHYIPNPAAKNPRCERCHMSTATMVRLAGYGERVRCPGWTSPVFLLRGLVR